MSQNAWKRVRSAVPFALIVGIGLSACTQMGVGQNSWKEEVLLHDGQKIIVERSQTDGGRHEIGQSVPGKEHTIRFTLPDSNRTLTWTSEYGEDLGRRNLNLSALHVKERTPYLAAEPNVCLSYNKWGRPNPPYVVFKHGGKEWVRVALSVVPVEFKNTNLVVNNCRLAVIRESSRSTGYVPIESVIKINASVTVTATDAASPAVSDGFDTVVADTDDAPTVANAIGDQRATEDTAFSPQVPANAFHGVDAGDTLTYGAPLSDVSPLPSCLTFDSATPAFSGNPTFANAGTVSACVTASDGAGASAADDLDLTVNL